MMHSQKTIKLQCILWRQATSQTIYLPEWI